MSHFGDYLRRERIRQGITVSDMARRLGYINLSKGCRRISAVEDGGSATPPDLPSKIVEILGIPDDTVKILLRKDFEDFQSWLNESVPMRMVIRLMAAVYSPHSLPASITTAEEAEAYARQFAKERRFKVCLILSRRVSIWIDNDGSIIARTEAEPGLPNAPFMQIGSKKFLLDFGGLK